jgi:RNA polymerase sigma-70 factor, ECF subfamily
MSTPTDEELIVAYLHGDDRAISVLIGRHVKMIYNYAYRLCGNAHDAEDISQEAFLRAWQHLRSFNARKTFRTWLFSITHNVAVDLLRKRRHLVFSAFDTDEGKNMLAETIADPAPLPDELVAQYEDAAHMERLLEALPVNHREVLVLHHSAEMTFEEIGAVLRKPLNTVKSQYRRALLSLRKTIETLDKPPEL